VGGGEGAAGGGCGDGELEERETWTAAALALPPVLRTADGALPLFVREVVDALGG
jgi:hypothetical protein